MVIVITISVTISDAACRLLPDVSRSVRTNRNEVTVIANAIAPLISI